MTASLPCILVYSICSRPCSLPCILYVVVLIHCPRLTCTYYGRYNDVESSSGDLVAVACCLPAAGDNWDEGRVRNRPVKTLNPLRGRAIQIDRVYLFKGWLTTRLDWIKMNGWRMDVLTVTGCLICSLAWVSQ